MSDKGTPAERGEAATRPASPSPEADEPSRAAAPPDPREALLAEQFGARIAGFEAVTGYCAVVVSAARLEEVARELKEASGYNFLRCLTGIDRGDHLEVVYNLMNLGTKEELLLKVKLPRESPEVPSVAALWPTANWLERETYDLFGIHFQGHPDLRRILLPDDWEGHPLRKDYEYRG